MGDRARPVADRAGEVRPRLASDATAVRRVARLAWVATYGAIAPRAFVAAVLRRAYDRERLVVGLADPRRDAFVAEAAGEVIGCADAVATAPGVADLGRLYVRPGAQGRGAGTALLGAVVAAAQARGARVLRTEVDAANEAGLAWFLRRGFRAVGASAFEIGAWRRPTVAMERPLGP